MTEPTLSARAKKLLALIPEKNSIGGRTLREAAGMKVDQYQAALAQLVEAGLVAVGRGHGGSVRHVDLKRRQFLGALPLDGSFKPNRDVREELGWDDEEYWQVRAELRRDGLILVGRGQGGSVARVPEPEVDEIAEPPKTRPAPPAASAKESAWYPILLYALQHEWAEDFATSIVRQTAWQGKKVTGGTWSRPDLTAVTLERFPILPHPVFDVWTFEVKRPADWSVVGVHEASAHGRRATRPVLLLVGAKEYEDWQREVLRSCEDEAARLGVGLVVADAPYHYENWRWIVQPERHEPVPSRLADFLERQLRYEDQEEIRSWWQKPAGS